MIANGVIDTAMAARFSTADLAALALGASIYISIFVGIGGVLQALAPIIGQLFGARQFKEIGYQVKQSCWLSLFLCIAGALILLFPQPFLALAQTSPELNAKATAYLQILALALPATLGFRIYSALNTAIARPVMVMLIQVAGLVLKIPLNALFIFGGLGLPAFGGPGCAIATTIVAWLMLIVVWAILRFGRLYRQFQLFNSGWVSPHWSAQRPLLALGVPMGLSYLIEVTAFTFMALFIARLGEVAVGGHQITASFATVLYMLPLSVASATGTLVAQAIGAQNIPLARKIGNDGLRLAALSSVALGIMVWFSRGTIIRAYSPDPAVIAAAIPLFAFISFYQLFDSIQVTAAFILRAYMIAIVPTVIYAVALWGVGLGGGYLLGFNLTGWTPRALQGASGFWFSNSVSIALVAGGLYCYLRRIQHQVDRR